MARLKSTVNNNYTVLVVDDQPEVLESNRQLLESEGYKVFTVQNGIEAIEMVEHNNYDIMILDYFMPEINGEDVVKAIREFNNELYIILNTGYSGEKPALEVMKTLNIQAYHDKSEGPDKLLLWLISAIKHYESSKVIKELERGLEFIIMSSREIFQSQNLEDFMRLAFEHVSHLISFTDGFICTKTANGNYLINGMGKYNGLSWEQIKTSGIMGELVSLYGYKKDITFGENEVLIPLTDARGYWVGIIALQNIRLENIKLFTKLLNIYTCNAAAAVINIWNMQDLKALEY